MGRLTPQVGDLGEVADLDGPHPWRGAPRAGGDLNVTWQGGEGTSVESKLSDMDRGFPSGLSLLVCKMGTPADRPHKAAGRGDIGGEVPAVPARAGSVPVTQDFRCRVPTPALLGGLSGVLVTKTPGTSQSKEDGHLPPKHRAPHGQPRRVGCSAVGDGRWCWLGGWTGGLFQGGDTQTRIWQMRRGLQGGKGWEGAGSSPTWAQPAGGGAAGRAGPASS